MGHHFSMFPQKYTLICPKIIFHTGTSRRPPQLARVSPAYYKNPLRGFCNTAAHSLGLAPQTRPASQKRAYHEITWISDSCLRHSQRPCGPNRTLKRKRYDEMARPKTDEPMDHIVAVRFSRKNRRWLVRLWRSCCVSRHDGNSR